MKKLIILLLMMLIASSCGTSKGLHRENTFRNFTVKCQINKEHHQTFVK